MITENIETVRRKIREACFRCGRKPEEVLLVGVSKTFSPEHIREAMAAGLRDFGESYAQELREKREQLREEDIRWHFIGHLQTNKVKYLTDFVYLIHSVDNIRVAEEINKRAEKAGRKVNILLEVCTTTEATKYGIMPDKTVELARQISKLPWISVQGLMTMGPFSDDPNDSRPSFRQLAELRKQIEQEGIPGITMQHLSMGMTHDFEVAIEEGATMVRIGTAIFGERKG
ncbi:MAG TPA: YggS family pyridoxal phosphate-dependent enzyme [Bacteroidota bacterium]|nr:YggS family pyridoxal phosphate-dependent enzyme [Bacteroidota bacterium]